MYRFAYMAYDAILAIFWLIFFFARKDLRKQQLFLSFLAAPFAPLTVLLWFYYDYWRPEYVISIKIGQVPQGIEGPLFAFLVGGISGVLYEAIFRKRHLFGKRRNILAFAMIPLALAITAILKIWDLNTIWATSIAFLSTATTMLLIDKDLIKDAIFSGIFMILLATFLYAIWLTIYPEAIQKFWITKSFSGIRLWKIPIEELVWFFTAGMVGGVFYEFWLNAESYPKK